MLFPQYIKRASWKNIESAWDKEVFQIDLVLRLFLIEKLFRIKRQTLTLQIAVKELQIQRP